MLLGRNIDLGWLPEDFGDTWEFFISEEFHTQNNLHQKIDQSYGAMWAVKTIGPFHKRDRFKIIAKKVYYWFKD